MIKGKNSRRSVVMVFCLLLLTVLSGCGGTEGTAPAGGAPGGMAGGGMRQNSVQIAVETKEITYETIEEYAKISCQVEAENSVNVQPKVSGTVEAVYVSVGDYVQAGQVLFEVDRSTLERQVTQANTNYVQAQVNYDAMQSGSLDNELANLQATVKDRQIAYENARQSYENNKILFESGAVSQTELDNLKATMESRRSDLESSERNLALYESTTMQGNRKTMEATLNQARSNYEAALDTLNDASVKAEISGVVSQVNVTVGNMVSTQTAAVQIVDMSRAKLAFGVTDKVINQIQVGTRAEVTISSLSSQPFEAVISAISPAADSQSMLYPVEIYLNNSNSAIKPGMFAMVRVATNKHEHTFSLPVDAVIEKNGVSSVFVVGDDLIAHKTEVQTGLRNDQYIEVVSGVNVGDIVVVVGQDFLEDGNGVNVTAGPVPAGAVMPEAAPGEGGMPPGKGAPAESVPGAGTPAPKQ